VEQFNRNERDEAVELLKLESLPVGVEVRGVEGTDSSGRRLAELGPNAAKVPSGEGETAPIGAACAAGVGCEALEREFGAIGHYAASAIGNAAEQKAHSASSRPTSQFVRLQQGQAVAAPR